MAEPWVAPEGSWASSEAIRKTMLRNRNRDTAPEIALRSMVHRAGLRFRVAKPPVRGIRRTADMVFARSRVAVFMDGCFWHGCPEHYVEPSTNVEYWRAKIGGNVSRDRDTDNRLAEAGWHVLRVWEHEPTVDAALAVVECVRSRVA